MFLYNKCITNLCSNDILVVVLGICYYLFILYIQTLLCIFYVYNIVLTLYSKPYFALNPFLSTEHFSGTEYFK